MKYKYLKLRGRIIEKFGSQGKFAEAIRLSENSVSKKLTGNSGFSQEDIEKWSYLLEISKEEYGLYFFA
ncbi:MAG: DUF739 family protein [Tyzzerella sp.]|nr:DUF739 family protein [Tyzzerella sp.]